jgi:hypothetical protein
MDDTYHCIPPCTTGLSKAEQVVNVYPLNSRRTLTYTRMPRSSVNAVVIILSGLYSCELSKLNVMSGENSGNSALRLVREHCIYTTRALVGSVTNSRHVIVTTAGFQAKLTTRLLHNLNTFLKIAFNPSSSTSAVERALVGLCNGRLISKIHTRTLWVMHLK